MPRSRLSRYRAKRDFERTAEPSGRKDGARRSGELRFVVQKHAARRLHYDLRLELDGTFRSWAVTKGPSLDPAERRLAVEVEDHPLDYGDFEGTIPKGEYGGGTVQLWDRGFWAPLPGVSPQKALKAGNLKFLMVGERLKGEWVLVRMKRDRNGGKRNNWLLIKHRDRFARENGDALLRKDRSVASGRRMADITAGRGDKPTPFMKAPRARPAKPAASNAEARKRVLQSVPGCASEGCRRAAKCRSVAAAVRPAATRAARPFRAAGFRLGSRDQVRRLPHADARGRRHGHAAYPQGPRLDEPFPGDRPRGRRTAGLPRRRGDRGPGQARRAELFGPAGRARRRGNRRLHLLPVRPAARRRQGLQEVPAGGAQATPVGTHRFEPCAACAMSSTSRRAPRRC